MNERGSALLLAIFMLVLLAVMGIGLHALGQNELFMSAAVRQSKQVYHLAEAGVEAGRQQLFDVNSNGTFDDELDVAAGVNDVLDFDPASLRPVYDSNGNVSGFTGYGDDQPLLDATALGNGWYAAFLTNDPANAGGSGSMTDSNDRLMITGVGAGRDGSLEIVQAIVDPTPLFPADLPAAITIFGDAPTFADANLVTKAFVGDDCNGAGIPGFNVPVFGLIGTPAESVVEAALSANPTYISGTDVGHVTVVDLTDPTDPGIVSSDLGVIDPLWIDCENLRRMAQEVREVADAVCIEGSPCVLPASSPDRIVFSEGDLTLGGAITGAGLLWVTGQLNIPGSEGWNGIIMVVGEGRLIRTGGGSSTVSGATIVADIAGPDNTYGTADDCTGGSAGFQPAVYDESGGGDGTTTYCNADVLAAMPITRYAVVEFRQM